MSRYSIVTCTVSSTLRGSRKIQTDLGNFVLKFLVTGRKISGGEEGELGLS